MVAKGEAEKQAEQVQFAAYGKWCKTTSTAKFRAINEAAESIQNLQADIEKYTSDAAFLKRAVARLDEDISEIEADMKSATKVRAEEHADFLAKERDVQESVQQMGTATDTVQAEAHDSAQTALTQVAKLPVLDEKDKKNIAALLSMDDEDRDAEFAATGAPQAAAHEFASQGILDMFGKMQAKFEAKLAQVREEEMEDKHAYDLLMMDQTNAKERAESDRAEKSAARGKALQAAGEAKAELADTIAAKAADEKFKKDLDATCAQKAADFESRQKLRTEELEAVNKAIEIMGGDAVSGSADKHLPGLLQVRKRGIQGHSLAQLRASTMNPNQVRVVNFLRAQGEKINSRVLSAIAMRASYDPFKSVKKMIKDMVVKLMEEANEEAEHKGWCDTELSTNEQTRNEKTEAVDLLNSEIDELSASIAQLTEEITELTNAVAASDKAVAEATEAREEEKAKNAVTVDDAKVAQEAVAQALTVLKNFYDAAAGATALVQQKKVAGQQKKQPEIFDAPYTGMQDNAGGVVGMIEVIQSDFARLESDTMASEAASQREYEQFMHDSEVDKTAKSKDIEHKSAKKQNQEQALTEKQMDLVGTTKELTAALAYYEKLKPSCVDSGISYEERVARRKAEIESLQEALKILNGDDIAVFMQK